MACLHQNLSTSGTAWPRSQRQHRSTAPQRVPCRSAPKYNPQNVENPVVLPSPDFTPSQAVDVQLKACSVNDEPWTNHGLQTMYEFAVDAGDMELAPYFAGSRVDLYHFDHFMGKFSTRLGPLVNCSAWKVVQERKDTPAPGMTEVDVDVVDRTGSPAGLFTFTLVQKEFGKKKGAWMTKMVGKKA